MAIQTAGYQVNAIPQVGIVSPNAAGNPALMLQGVLQAYQLAETQKKLQALALAQSEAQATQQARIDAQNARNLAIAQVAPQQALADIATAQGTAQTAPVATQAAIQTIPALAASQVAQANKTATLAPIETDAARATIPALASAQVAGARANEANSKIDLATAPARQSAALIQTQAQADRAPIEEDIKLANAQLAKLKSDYDRILAPQEAQLKLREVQDTIARNPNSVAELNKALLNAKIDLEKAQGAEAYARGEYYLGNGKQAPSKPISPSLMVQQLTSAIDRLNNTAVGTTDGKKKTLAEYEQERLAGPGFFTRQSTFDSQKSAAAEAMIAKRNNLLGALEKAMQGLTTEGLDASISLPTATSGTFKSAADVQAAYRSGQIDRATAAKILVEQFGANP